jgi:hypothetical protein
MQPIFGQRHLQNIKIPKAAGPQYVLNRIVKYHLERALNSLKKLLMAVFRMPYVPRAWEQPRLILAGTGAQKDLLFCRFLFLLDTAGKVSAFMLVGIVSDLRSHVSLRDEQLELRVYNRTSERLNRPFARFNRSVEEQLLTRD